MTTVVVTGAAGFIGSEIVRHLVQAGEVDVVYAVIRAQGDQSAQARFEKIVTHWQRYLTIDAQAVGKVKVVEADLTMNPLLLADQIRDANVVYHCAASTDIGMPLVPSRRANVVGTQKAVQWARQFPSLERFMHFSTAYVLGSMQGSIREENQPRRFNNGYEQSKFEAEQVVKCSGLPHTIVRPSLVVGDSSTGYVRGYKIIYAALRAWLTNAMPRAPLDPRAHVDIVPVDYVVRAAIKLAQLPAAEGEIYHLASGNQARSTMEIFRYAIKVFQLETPSMSHPWMARLLVKPWVRPFIGHRLRHIVELMNTHVPYLGARNRFFVTEKADLVLRPYGLVCPRLDHYGETMFKFCRDSHWGKRPLRKAEVNV